LLAWADCHEEAGDIGTANTIRLMGKLPALIAIPSTDPLKWLYFSVDGGEDWLDGQRASAQRELRHQLKLIADDEVKDDE
jgi:hypothetical protein